MQIKMKSFYKILIAGTPGTGKSTLVDEICDQYPNIEHIDISKFAKEHNLIAEYDEDYESHVIDEEKLLDEIKDYLETLDANINTIIFEYHGIDLFPKNMFDAIFILRTDNTILYDRLHKRGYNPKKLEDNVQCEIFQTIADEAKHYISGQEDRVHLEQLPSNTPDDMELNANKIINLIVK